MWNPVSIHFPFSKSEHMICGGERGKSSALLQNSDINSFIDYYGYMRSSIICLEKFNGALNFTILQLKFILNSLQNSSITISATKNI